MSTLSTNVLKSNQNVHVNHDGGQLSSDAGLLLISEFMNILNFDFYAESLVPYEDTRSRFDYSNTHLLKQRLFMLLAGYKQDNAASFLSKDPLLSVLLNTKIASQPSLSRHLDRMTSDTIDGFSKLNQMFLDYGRNQLNTTEMIIDIDSTHSDTFGNQESSDYNHHYRTNGYHPLIATEATTGAILGAQLRPGNVYTSTGVDTFLEPILQHFKDTPPVTDILIRGDSGFATPDLYKLIERFEQTFVIRLKLNARLSGMVAHIEYRGDSDTLFKRECHYSDIIYQADSWDRPRRVCVESTREAGELCFSHIFIVTNLSANVKPEVIFATYRKRGSMENIIKEAKYDFFFDKTDSSDFVENSAHMMMGVLAYNIVNLMRRLCFVKEQKTMQMTTIRHQYIRVAAKVVRSKRKIWLKLSSAHVYQQEFNHIFERIQRLRPA